MNDKNAFQPAVFITGAAGTATERMQLDGAGFRARRFWPVPSSIAP